MSRFLFYSLMRSAGWLVLIFTWGTALAADFSSGPTSAQSGGADTRAAEFVDDGMPRAVDSDAGHWALVSSIYSSGISLAGHSPGIGFHAPFGWESKGGDGGAGMRYIALAPPWQGADAGLAVMYGASDRILFGAGVESWYLEAPHPVGFDGAGLGDRGYAYSLGAMLASGEGSGIVLSYRSKIRQRPMPNDGLVLPFDLSPSYVMGSSFDGAGEGFALPESLSLNAYADLDSAWSVTGGMTWMHWSSFTGLRFGAPDGAPYGGMLAQWRNTMRVTAAVAYHYSDAWKLRAGIAYDPALPHDEIHAPRIAEADHTWFSLGAQFKPSPNSAVAVGYKRLLMRDAVANRGELPFAGGSLGNYDGDDNILSVQYSRNF